MRIAFIHDRDPMMLCREEHFVARAREITHGQGVPLAYDGRPSTASPP